MPHRVSRVPSTIVAFSETHRIEAEDLARAIGGGISRGSLGAATAEQREEIAAETHLAIVEHAAAGKALEGALGSLAFAIAFNKTRDIFRRTRADALCHRREGGAAEIAFEAAPCEAEAAEARVARLGETKLQNAILRAGCAKAPARDRAVLLAMLARREAMPRGTPEQRRVANATAQAEKRARDRLARAVREAGRSAGRDAER